MAPFVELLALPHRAVPILLPWWESENLEDVGPREVVGLLLHLNASPCHHMAKIPYLAAYLYVPCAAHAGTPLLAQGPLGNSQALQGVSPSLPQGYFDVIYLC